jgi:hypothetical protein
VMVLEQDDFAKYDDWQLTHTTEPSLLHFLTGGAGAIFPPTIQLSLKRASTGFVSRCPRADDIWLNVHSLRAGYKVRQIAKESFRLVEIPGTQSLALSHSNVVCKENDRQIRTTYTASDVRALRDEPAHSTQIYCGANFHIFHCLCGWADRAGSPLMDCWPSSIGRCS